MQKKISLFGKRLELPKPSLKGNWEKRPGGWWIFTDENGKRHRLRVHQKGEQVSVLLKGTPYFGKWVSPQSDAEGGDAGEDKLISQFPGKVRKVLVKEGDSVKEGQKLLVVEAMKMEFSIEAPYDGKVTRIQVSEEEQILPGTRFLELEASDA